MDREAWDQRYGGERLWSAEPNRSLVEEAAALPPGRALDLGAGEGTDAVWLAERGWRVTGVDFSQVALSRARELAEERGVAVEWVAADLLDYVPPADAFDLVVIMYLHLPPEDRRVVIERAASAVGPGGKLLVVGHHPDNVEHGVGGPQDVGRLYAPTDIEDDLAATPLAIERAERVLRPVTTDGSPGTAIDTLVHAARSR